MTGPNPQVDASWTNRFRKKPVAIDAFRWDGTNQTDIINWVLDEGGTARYHDNEHIPSLSQLAIDTLEGTMRADIGDWIIRGVKGEFYPCKPDIFDATYEPAALAASDAETSARAAFQKYAWHLSTCPNATKPSEAKCECGFENAWFALLTEEQG